MAPDTSRDSLPLWHMNFKLFGSASISSSSYFPVEARLEGARSQMTTTPSNFPLLHSWINSVLFLDSVVTRSAISESLFHEVLALERLKCQSYPHCCALEPEAEAVPTRYSLLNFAKQQRLWFAHFVI